MIKSSKKFKIKNRVHDNNMLGDIIKISRVLAGLTQSELAEKAGTHQIMVTKIETGQSGGGIGTFYKLFNVLKPPIDVSINKYKIYGD